ncbi:MAG: hypothetical protein Kow00128_19430 [Deltaproteobacteria bacterium]
MPRRARILAFFALIPWAVASLSGVPIEPDERKIDPLLLATDIPAVTATQRRIAGSPARAPVPVPLFFRLGTDDLSFPERVRALGGSARRVAAGLYTGRIPRDAARYLSNRPEVAYLEAARIARPLLDLSAPAVRADAVHAGSVNWPPPFDLGIRGDNVYVGVVDTGVSGTHSDFSGRIIHTYSFSPSTADPLVDTDGHGTHVTGIAAGSGFSSSGTYTGMAPGASILFGKTSFFTTDIVNAVSDLLAFAGTSPVAVNLSLGLATGPHDGSSTFESGVNSLATGSTGSKRLIVAAAGNEQADGEHFHAALPPFGIVTAVLTLQDTFGATAEFWADGEDRYTVQAILGGESITVASGSSGSSGTGRISVSNRRTSPPNGATLISVAFLAQSAGQNGTVRLTRTRNGGSGTVDGYIDLREGTFNPSTPSGTVTEPANADNVIAVGSFDTKTYPGGAPVAVPDISYFSSLGPTRDGRTKPDLAAPGYVIYSARSFDAPAGNYWDIVPGNDNYAILAGTSMAAPHVTGIAALVWESNRSLTGAQMRERLRKTADPPPGAPDNSWGSGIVNAYRAVTESVAAITAPRSVPPGTPVTLTSENSSAAFDNNALDTYIWSLTPPVGSAAALSGNGSPTATFTPDIPGEYRVDLTVSQSTPSSIPPGSDSRVIHVNTIPVAIIDAPNPTGTLDPVSFSGTRSTDPDGDPISGYHWVLVSRPAGSAVMALTPSGPDDAVLSPDVAGTYVVGLRVDDGLDNSALATTSFTAGPVPVGSGGGSGSCSLSPVDRSGSSRPLPLAPVLYLIPPALLALRRSVAGRRLRHPSCYPTGKPRHGGCP